MKQSVFITFLVLASCFTAFGQSDENICPKIKIKVPEYIYKGDGTVVSANFENEKQPSTSKFNWTIIKEDKLTRIAERGIIEISSEDMKNDGMIILLADSLNKACQNTRVARIPVIERVGSPRIFDAYSKLDWNEEQARLNNVLYSMKDNKTDELLVFLNFEKTASQIERKTYLTKILNYLSGTDRLEKNRITFLISEAESRWVKFQSVPQNAIDVFFDWNNSLLIKGEDFDKLNNLFQPKTRLTKNN
jgi:hypothetical protein